MLPPKQITQPLLFPVLSVAVSAESGSGSICAGVASETFKSGIIMPWSFFRFHEVAGMDIGVCALDTIPIAMAAGLAAGEALIVMARGARFDISPGKISMSAGIGPRIPGFIKVTERDDILLVVAITAESLEIMAALALRLLALGIEAVIEAVVQVVNGFNQIVTGVTVAAERLGMMTWGA
jgi:hypothetical protein